MWLAKGGADQEPTWESCNLPGQHRAVGLEEQGWQGLLADPLGLWQAWRSLQLSPPSLSTTFRTTGSQSTACSCLNTERQCRGCRFLTSRLSQMQGAQLSFGLTGILFFHASGSLHMLCSWPATQGNQGFRIAPLSLDLTEPLSSQVKLTLRMFQDLNEIMYVECPIHSIVGAC